MNEETTVTDVIDGYQVTLVWSAGLSQGGPQRLLIEPLDADNPPPGITSTVLRKVSFREWADKIRDKRQTADAVDAESLRAALADGVADNDRYLAMLSAAYVAAIDAGHKPPTKYLADLLGKSTETIRGHLWKARQRGYLEGHQGKAGGTLTAAGRALLEG
ncbi:hypothetical protein ACFVVM_12405 [Nocardia sp. NPDC058176]|uniref:hypothetical protein n=1 Tax=Nocardia sp. NPDC058176 TaxID=3346368 RepID=UPI0036DE92E9